MIELYAKTIQVMEHAFRQLEEQVPKPKLVSLRGARVFRYAQPSIPIALVLRAARLISGLNASLLLIRHGFSQEAYCIFRTLDEFNEDITFLSIPSATGEDTENHKRFIEIMFMEERMSSGAESYVEKKKPTMRRDAIHTAIAQSSSHLAEPSGTKRTLTTLQATFSGYLHGAADCIMDLYGGSPPRFNISGTKGTRRDEESVRCASNYFYRSLVSLMMVSTVLGNDSVHESLAELKKVYESKANMV